MATLRAQYGPLLDLVKTIIGVVPKCDEYMEIWPPAFRTYNIMVPNFLNLPFAILGFGGAPADVVGIGMYVASRVAECPYCSAHTCSFSLRRGASPEKVAQALVGSGAPFTTRELATIGVARSLARVPCEVLPSEREALEKCFNAADAEWIVAGICMMGFLNKFMDAVGVELEPSTAAEVATTLGASWSSGKAGRDLDPSAPATRTPTADSLWTKLSILPLVPFALRTDKEWQRGVPDSWPKVGEFLHGISGHDFPMLSRLQHARVIKSVASMLRENLDPSTSVIGLEIKVLAGVVFASVIGDASLEREVRALGPKYGVGVVELDSAAHFALTESAIPLATAPRDLALLRLARAVSPSPVAVDGETIAVCREAGLSPSALVELVTWLSVLQMLHRLSSYFVAAS